MLGEGRPRPGKEGKLVYRVLTLDSWGWLQQGRLEPTRLELVRMPEFDFKIVVIGALFVALLLAKLLAGGRPFDRPVRRARRFGYKGTLSPLRDAEGKPVLHALPPLDPEKEFFGEDDQS